MLVCVVYRKEGVFWICIRSKSPKYELLPDIDGLLADWHKLQRNAEVMLPAIMSAAKTRNATSGKWMTFCRSGCHVDELWKTVATAVNDGRLQATAKVSSVDGTGKHVICVYNDNFTDEHQVVGLCCWCCELRLSTTSVEFCKRIIYYYLLQNMLLSIKLTAAASIKIDQTTGWCSPGASCSLPRKRCYKLRENAAYYTFICNKCT